MHSPRNQASFLVAFLATITFLIMVIKGAQHSWNWPVVIGGFLCWILLEDDSGNERQSPLVGFLYRCLTCSKFQSLANCFHKDIHHRLVKTTWLFVVIPCVAYFAIRTAGHIGSSHARHANDFGFLGVVAMSFFLIPVSRQSVIMEALGIGSVHATRLHVWAGVIALFGGFVHGLYYCWIWFILLDLSLYDVLPENDCWTKDYSGGCRGKFVNLTGFIAVIAFIILGTSSIWWVRRRFYRLFYYSHIACSFIVVFALAMHYNKMILYLAPSLIYYFASNVPHIMEWLYRWAKGGSSISKVVDIPDSGDCVELSLRMSDQTSSALCGRYIRLDVPSISAKSHPFSFFTHVDHPGELKVIFRAYGPFTRKLLVALTSPEATSYPRVVVNGIRSGSNQWNHALQHDTIIIFAGGVGIVSYITLLSSMASLSKSDNADGIRKQKSVRVHWACRDEGLIEYVSEKYLAPLQNRAGISNIEITVVIHHTSMTPRESVVRQNESFGDSEASVSKPESTITSSFESGDRSMLRNLLSGTAFGFIGFGGIAIVAYCYENVQSRRVVETRSIVVVALIVWAIAVPIVVLLVSRLASCVQPTAAYFRLDRSDEVECTELDNAQFDTDDSSPDSENSDNCFDELAPSEELAGKSWMTILREDERPNLKVVIMEAVGKAADNEIQNPDVGVFVCGPNSLIDAVRTTANSLSRGRNNCAKIPIDVYDEIFEL